MTTPETKPDNKPPPLADLPALLESMQRRLDGLEAGKQKEEWKGELTLLRQQIAAMEARLEAAGTKSPSPGAPQAAIVPQAGGAAPPVADELDDYMWKRTP